MTRAEYLASRDPGAHREYYGGILAAAGGLPAIRRHIPASVPEIRAALAAGDADLNSIPLARWGFLGPAPAAVGRAFRDRGDYLTLAGAVCLLKEAALQAAEGRA